MILRIAVLVGKVIDLVEAIASKNDRRAKELLQTIPRMIHNTTDKTGKDVGGKLRELKTGRALRSNELN